MHSYGFVRKCNDFPSNTWHVRTISCLAFRSRSQDFMTPKRTQIGHVDNALQVSTCALTQAKNYKHHKCTSGVYIQQSENERNRYVNNEQHN